jgi:hypothetical protein
MMTLRIPNGEKTASSTNDVEIFGYAKDEIEL